MAVLSEEQQADIIRRLEERGARLPCPRCGNQDFSILDRYIHIPLQEDLETFNVGGVWMPSIAAVCTRCGYISQHLLGVLDLRPGEEE